VRAVEVKDAETGQVLADRVEWVKFSGIAWTHDDRGFYYARFPAPEDAASKSEDKRGTSAASNLNQEVRPSSSPFRIWHLIWVVGLWFD
jgi:hypothetical protein